ncbi:type II toxin-antitoxin system VapC family toxin [Bacteroides caecimuris]|uniref:type II toxin-antitoxin system VapC family toxin n=1 Tax=Bacteroides caecimuris TaxID=1796613 RepID=UPI001C3CF8C3|nr:type II toxin-antitoxin system VapC family toxin [Bacteroides caecimuris]
MENKYLLDSNICVYILRDKKDMRERLKKAGWNNCYISEITVAELLYGAECSSAVEENKKAVLSFCSDMKIIPISLALAEYASQKARLRKKGILIDDLDLFIGCTAVTSNCIMVTENVKHLNRIDNIHIENWVE